MPLFRRPQSKKADPEIADAEDNKDSHALTRLLNVSTVKNGTGSVAGDNSNTAVTSDSHRDELSASDVCIIKYPKDARPDGQVPASKQYHDLDEALPGLLRTLPDDDRIRILILPDPSEIRCPEGRDLKDKRTPRRATLDDQEYLEKVVDAFTHLSTEKFPCYQLTTSKIILESKKSKIILEPQLRRRKRSDSSVDLVAIGQIPKNTTYPWSKMELKVLSKPDLGAGHYVFDPSMSTFCTKPPSTLHTKVFGRKEVNPAADGSVIPMIVVITIQGLDLRREIINSWNISYDENLVDPVTFLPQRIVEVMEDWTAEVLNIVHYGIVRLRYAVREEPSWSKMNTLLYLEDHIEHVSKLLREIPMTADAPKYPPTYTKTNRNQNPPTALTRDLKYLSQLVESADGLLDDLKSVRESLRDQLASKDSTRNRLFDVLAAIYMPFTLASSVLGMNVKGLTNDTKASWVLYIAVGLPLAAVTVALPLSFDHFYKSMVSFIAANPARFKRLTIGISITFSILTVLVVIVVISILVTRR